MASMRVGVESQKVIKPFSCIFKITSLFLLIFVGPTSSQNIQCPFDYIYHFGDGATDIGNSVRVLLEGPSLPATRLPYGQTFPGTPTGRWSNGLVDVDFTASDVGLPNIVPYLALNQSINTNSSYDGVIFSVESSPVLNREFFTARDVNFPSYIAPLSLQLNWFRQYLTSVCSNPQDCDRITDSILLFGDIEANDVGRSLIQGKSIQQVRTYLPQITDAQINAGRELIRMGAKRIAFTASAPLGCYPYILTNLSSSSPLAYDELGCLKSVNDLIVSKNNQLLRAVKDLILEYPQVTIIYADYYTFARVVIAETHAAGDVNLALKACCGIGGRYNFDNRRLCGSPGVPVCSNPDRYIFWDGFHLTQNAYHRIERLLVPPAMPLVGCTIQL